MTTTDTPTTQPRTREDIEVRWCRPGEIGPAEPGRDRPDDAVLWVDVALDCPAERVLARLGELGVEVTEEQVADMLLRDEMPVLVEAGPVRNVSLVGVVVTHRTGTVGDVTFQSIETLVGPGWAVTCWQHSRVCRGEGVDDDAAPELVDPVVAEVCATWAERRLTTAGDLATAHAAVLTKQYRRVYAALEDRLRAWERGFHVDGADAAGAGLKPLIGMVTETQRRLLAFNDNRSLASNGQWFADADRALDDHADHHLDRMLRRLAELSQSIRADMELVSMEQMAQAAREAKAASDRDAVFNTRLSVVTAFLLVPTLIAGIFGANTAVPGGGTWPGFAVMVVLMVVSGLGVWWAMFHRDAKKSRQRS